MKKILFLALLAFAGISAKAQQYVPFPDSNAYWSEFYSEYGFPNYKYTYFIKGDTIIDLQPYHKIYQNDSTSIPFYGYLREYNKRIYFFITPTGCSHEVLLYDFNLNIGDSIKLSCELCDTTLPNYMTVTSIDSVLLTDMKYRKRLNFNNVVGISSWVEGIGSMGGLLYPYYSCSACECFTESVCFKQNDTTLYINPYNNTVSCFNYINSINEFKNKEDLITISPNPATSEIEVTSNQSSVNGIEIYNMLGEKVYCSPITDYRSPFTVNVSSFPVGMYFVEIFTKKGREVKKFIKE